jgi:hypothetical protein
MEDQKILEFLRRSGPILPAQLAKFINSNILLSSAHLSELSSRRLVLVSDLKVGGSPLYYLPGQEAKLFDFRHHLNPKDQETVEYLKGKKILREKELDLFMRVSLRKVKDFAKPITVTVNGSKELFWKWYLINDEEAKRLIAPLLSGDSSSPSESMAAVHAPVSHTAPEVPVPTPVHLSRQETITTQPQVVREDIRQQPETVPVADGTLQQTSHVTDETMHSAGEKELTKQLPSIGKSEPKSKNRVTDVIRSLKRKIPKRKGEDTLLPRVEAFFRKRNITIESKETIRKNSEMNFILTVPSEIGNITYFCKVKDKKRCDDKDVSSAYMEGQMKKLPTILLYTNELHKKAEELLDSEMFTNLRAVRLQ